MIDYGKLFHKTHLKVLEVVLNSGKIFHASHKGLLRWKQEPAEVSVIANGIIGSSSIATVSFLLLWAYNYH